MFAWLLVPTGLLMIMYASKLNQITGDIPFAERYFSAGTTSFYKALGLATMILSFMWATGGIQGVISSFIEPFV